jgi:hypothetical protein
LSTKSRKDNLPHFMSPDEYTCPKCANIERGNVDPERVVACSWCCMGAMVHVEHHPEQYGLKKEAVALRKLKGPARDVKFCARKGCSKPFTPTNNRQEFCPSCRKFARAERARLLEKQKRESATGL